MIQLSQAACTLTPALLVPRILFTLLDEKGNWCTLNPEWRKVWEYNNIEDYGIEDFCE